VAKRKARTPKKIEEDKKRVDDGEDFEELTDQEFDKLCRIIPGENLSRHLSNLGRLRTIMDALSTPEGQEFLGRINRNILECENFILNNVSMGDDTPKMREMKVRFKVYKEEAEHYLEQVVSYNRGVKVLKEAAREQE